MPRPSSVVVPLSKELYSNCPNEFGELSPKGVVETLEEGLP